MLKSGLEVDTNKTMDTHASGLATSAANCCRCRELYRDSRATNTAKFGLFDRIQIDQDVPQLPEGLACERGTLGWNP